MEIILNDLSYIYDEGTAYEKSALAGINLKIRQGEFISLIGKTGSGKSTLIRMFNGLLKPTYGQVFVDGEDINEKGYPLRVLRGRVGMVFQYPEDQLFETSVIEDVKFGPTNQGLDLLTIEYRAFEALKNVGIGEDLLDVSPLELSGGQKRRVAIAGVLAMQPELLILDEPTAGLDPKGREEILRLLKDLQTEKNITILLISHRMEDVASYADRVIVLNDGMLYCDGTPAEVFTRHDELEKVGLRAPQYTYIIEELYKRGVKVTHGAITLEQAVDAIVGGRSTDGR